MLVQCDDCVDYCYWSCITDAQFVKLLILLLLLLPTFFFFFFSFPISFIPGKKQLWQSKGNQGLYFRQISANSLIAQCQTDLQHKSKQSIFSHSLSFHIPVKTEGCTLILQTSWSNRSMRKANRKQRKGMASSRISGNPSFSFWLPWLSS